MSYQMIISNGDVDCFDALSLFIIDGPNNILFFNASSFIKIHGIDSLGYGKFHCVSDEDIRHFRAMIKDMKPRSEQAEKTIVFADYSKFYWYPELYRWAGHIIIQQEMMTASQFNAFKFERVYTLIRACRPKYLTFIFDKMPEKLICQRLEKLIV